MSKSLYSQPSTLTSSLRVSMVVLINVTLSQALLLREDLHKISCTITRGSLSGKCVFFSSGDYSLYISCTVEMSACHWVTSVGLKEKGCDPCRSTLFIIILSITIIYRFILFLIFISLYVLIICVSFYLWGTTCVFKCAFIDKLTWIKTENGFEGRKTPSGLFLSQTPKLSNLPQALTSQLESSDFKSQTLRLLFLILLNVNKQMQRMDGVKKKKLLPCLLRKR